MMIEQELKGYEMNMKTMYSYCIVLTNTLFDSISESLFKFYCDYPFLICNEYGVG